MKKLFLIGIVLAFAIWSGCSSSKEESSPTGPTGPTTQRIVANTTAGAPSMTDANDATWNAVAATAVDLKSTNSPKISNPAAQNAPDSIYLQAIVDATDLYIRIDYTDDSLNLLRDFVYCHDTANKNFTLQPLGNEDQIFVLFAGLPNSAWDMWNWRSLGTAPAGLAEDFIFRNDSMIVDSGGQEVTIVNPLSFQRPRWVHNTGPAFTGEILYIEDTSAITPFLNSVWDTNQVVPGFVVDTAVGGRVQPGQPYESSRWDVFSVHSYNSTTNRLAVVLKRKKVVPYGQDLDFVDSVKVKVGILDEQDDLIVAGGRRGFSQEFWLIL